MDKSRFSGIGTLNASANAAVMVEALGKRAAGSLAMLRRMTTESGGKISGLIREGGVRVALMCSIRIADALSPRNGGIPVHIS